MKTKWKLFLIVLTVSMLVLAGCGGGDSEQLTIGVDTMFVPFEFEQDGEMVGFDIDILEELSERMGFEYEIQTMEFRGLIPALTSNSIDMAFAGMTITEERQETIDFSIPYYDAGLLIMVLEDNDDINGIEDLAGRRVATRTGTSSYDYLMSLDFINENDVIAFDNMDAAYFELLTEGVDATLWDSPAQQYYVQTEGEGQVKLVGELLEGQQYGIGLPKGSELKEDVDAALEAMMEDGTYEELYVKWFGEMPQ
ncbi:glutamine ABC transporter substrate-binding protein [Dethiobacter alkaliphilus]|uniref:Extracellular solute-binding protein family 3 n=1 Tax=Dethiobacter alkaliphilus AHT 1 TaxID=555088 RepID=C0GCT2_DETAL|nr:glutamine ABC transporter substrate-binding protein [Dethiobacter alkaliphilus]EEG79017.1 extracellular solute-binding protein family 3 [Dethiobacter alkaliphilus AHT 1]